MQNNHEPTTVWHHFIQFHFLQTHWKLTDMQSNGFIAPSACVHKIIKHIDDVLKLPGWNCMILLAKVHYVIIISFNLHLHMLTVFQA